jgi:hypothetical protein
MYDEYCTFAYLTKNTTKRVCLRLKVLAAIPDGVLVFLGTELLSLTERTTLPSIRLNSEILSCMYFYPVSYLQVMRSTNSK